MKFKVLSIEFDEIYAREIGIGDRKINRLTAKVIGKAWEAEDGDDLIDKITDITGCSINVIDYKKDFNT